MAREPNLVSESDYVKFGESADREYRCRCGAETLRREFKFCPYCGQPLIWENPATSLCLRRHTHTIEAGCWQERPIAIREEERRLELKTHFPTPPAR